MAADSLWVSAGGTHGACGASTLGRFLFVAVDVECTAIQQSVCYRASLDPPQDGFQFVRADSDPDDVKLSSLYAFGNGLKVSIYRTNKQQKGCNCYARPGNPLAPALSLQRGKQKLFPSLCKLFTLYCWILVHTVVVVSEFCSHYGIISEFSSHCGIILEFSSHCGIGFRI